MVKVMITVLELEERLMVLEVEERMIKGRRRSGKETVVRRRESRLAFAFDRTQGMGGKETKVLYVCSSEWFHATRRGGRSRVGILPPGSEPMGQGFQFVARGQPFDVAVVVDKGAVEDLRVGGGGAAYETRVSDESGGRWNALRRTSKS